MRYHGRPHPNVAHLGCMVAKIGHLFFLAAKQFDQQCSANIQRFIHGGVHLRVQLHRPATDLTQYASHAASRQDKNRQHG